NRFGDFPGNGVPCAVREQVPHSLKLADSRGGVRILGTVHDFTFSLASYFTWQDAATSEAGIYSPTPEHLAWDISGATFKPLTNAGVTTSPFIDPAFLPGGQFASEGSCPREDGLGIRGCRRGRFESRDVWAFAIGLDHNQWIRWLNPVNSFTISAQIFKADVIGDKNIFNRNKPAGLDNDRFSTGFTIRSAAPTGPTTDPKKL